MNRMASPRAWRVVLAVMFVPLAFIAFWPSPLDQPLQGQLARAIDFLHAQGIPAWFNYKVVEAYANLVLFSPVGFVAAFAFPQNRWWQTGAFALAVSGSMELGQLLFLHDRFASPLDLVTNTGGGVIGALLARTFGDARGVHARA